MLETRPRTLLRALIATAALALAAPSFAGAADQLTLIDQTEQVGPGISLNHQKFLNSSGWYDTQVLTVDLANGAVKSDLLTAPKVAQGEALTTMANRAGAAAGVNGDFFDIDSTQASTGGEIQGGALIKSPSFGGWAHVGVSKTGIGQLVDMTLQATATLNGTPQPILTHQRGQRERRPRRQHGRLHVRLGQPDPQPRHGGRRERRRGPGDQTTRSSRSTRPPAPARSPKAPTTSSAATAAADAIKALKPGDPVTLTYGLKDAAAQQMQWAIGTNKPLVTNGVALAQGDTSIAPRTAIGFKDGGKTMFLLITDGRQTQVALGTTLKQTADMLVALGADTGLNLDGGGSTTLVARPLGGDQATLRNTPSDGTQRADPTGIGLFVTPGDGKVDSLAVTPADARVFPGLHRTLTATALDDHQVAVKDADVTWSAGAAGGNLHAPSDAKDDITVTATSGAVKQDTKVRVLHALRTLELSSGRLSYADALPTLAQTLKVTGRDDQGYAAPIELQDMTLDYDHDLIKVEETAAGALKITPLKAGGTTLDVKVAGLEEKLPITIGVVQSNVYTFNHADEVARWNVNGTIAANQTLGLSPEGFLTLTYKAERNSGISAKYAAFQITLPGSPLRVHLKLHSTAALALSYIGYRDAKGVTYGPLGSPVKVGDNDLVFTFPTTVTFPVTITSSQVIETNVANQKHGVVTFKSIDADNSATVASPPQDELQPDALFSADGTTNGKDDWSLRRRSPTSSSPPPTRRWPRSASPRSSASARRNPDLIVLNGDVTDNGAAEDMTLARKTLEQGGCRLIPLTSTIGTDTHAGADRRHDAVLLRPRQPRVLPRRRPGRPRPVHRRVRPAVRHVRPQRHALHRARQLLRQPAQHVLGAAADASSRRSRTPRPNPAVKNVMVFAHHPVDDPAETDASQLGDRTEVALVEKLLTDFREHSNKGVSMVGSHAQIADVHRIEGVPYTVLPVLGQGPVRHAGPRRLHRLAELERRQGRDRRPAVADRRRPRVRAVDHPQRAGDPRGRRHARSWTAASCSRTGVANGTRVVPLRYPMSIHWSGSDNLAIGTDIAAAKAAGKVAILDPATRKLTGLHTGDVTVKVTNESMREYTDEASLAPVSTEKTIHVQVTHVGADAPVGGQVPATLALTLGAPASFGAFTPGVTKDYTASTTANVTSSAGDAALSASTVKLTNGAFSLAQPVVVTPEKSVWTGPVANDAFAIAFKQSIAATRPAADRQLQRGGHVHAVDDHAVRRSGHGGDQQVGDRRGGLRPRVEVALGAVAAELGEAAPPARGSRRPRRRRSGRGRGPCRSSP